MIIFTNHFSFFMYIIYKEYRRYSEGWQVKQLCIHSVRWTGLVWCIHKTSRRWRRWVWSYRTAVRQPHGRGPTWPCRQGEQSGTESAQHAALTGLTSPAPRRSLRPSTEESSSCLWWGVMKARWCSSSASAGPAPRAWRAHLPARAWGARSAAAWRTGRRPRCWWRRAQFSEGCHCND